MKSLFNIKNLASYAIVTFFLVMAVGSDGSSNNDEYSTESDSEGLEKIEIEPDFSMDMSSEEVETVEIEPDFSDEEEESLSQGYINASEIDTTFIDAQEPDFE